MVEGYRLAGELGAGAAGRLAAAVEERTGRPVVLRFLAPGLLADGRFMGTFPAEAERLARLSDPHVAAVLGFVGTPDGGAVAVSEYIEGTGLDALLAARGPVGATAALVVLDGVLRGLLALHGAGVLHQACRPSSVLVTAGGPVVLTDVGLAPRDPGAPRDPAYAAPELARGATASQVADLYAATGVLLAGLTGRAPAPGAPDLSEVPAPLRDLVARGRAESPGARPMSAGAYAAELDEAASGAYGRTWREAGLAALAAAASGQGTLAVPPPGPGGDPTAVDFPALSMADVPMPDATMLDVPVRSAAVGGVGGAVLNPSGPATAHRTLTRPVPAPAAPAPSRGRRMQLLLAGAAVLVSLGILGGVAVLRMNQSPASAAASSSSPAAAGPASSAVASAPVTGTGPGSSAPSSGASGGVAPGAPAAGASAAPPSTAPAGPGHDCGPTGFQALGRVTHLVITTGKISCAEAMKVEKTYESPSTPRQGSGGFATFDGWTCGHDSVAGIQAGDRDIAGCGRDDKTAGFALRIAN